MRAKICFDISEAKFEIRVTGLAGLTVPGKETPKQVITDCASELSNET